MPSTAHLSPPAAQIPVWPSARKSPLTPGTGGEGAFASTRGSLLLVGQQKVNLEAEVCEENPSSKVFRDSTLFLPLHNTVLKWFIDLRLVFSSVPLC